MAGVTRSLIATCALLLATANVVHGRTRFANQAAIRRHLLQAESDGPGSIAGGVTVGDRHYLDLNETQIRGIYEGLGQNYPESIWSSFFPPEAFPNCNSNKTLVNWEHFGPTDAPFVSISEHDANSSQLVEAHHRGTYGARILGYNNSIIQLQSLTDEENQYCVHWQPYVDILTGELLINSVTMAMWTRENDTNVYTDFNCDFVAGNEKPGCYLGDVARYPSTPAIEARAAAAEASGNFTGRPNGSVISVAVGTYKCRNGECGASSPKYARIDAEHEEEE